MEIVLLLGAAEAEETDGRRLEISERSRVSRTHRGGDHSEQMVG